MHKNRPPLRDALPFTPSHTHDNKKATLRVVPMLCPQEPVAATDAPSLAKDLAKPLAQREAPMASNQNTGQHVDELEDKSEKAVAVLVDGEQDGLDVVLNKDTGHAELGDALALLRHGILVREHGSGADAVPGRYDGDVVLELVEVILGNVDGAVERVDERGIVRAEGQFRDDVRKIEAYRSS